MYIRKTYRQPPPNYSGVAFVKGEPIGILPKEEGSLSDRQKTVHQEALARMSGPKSEIVGRDLVPTVGGEAGIPTVLVSEATPKESFDEIFLLGLLFVLLTEGLDEESILLLAVILLLL